MLKEIIFLDFLKVNPTANSRYDRISLRSAESRRHIIIRYRQEMEKPTSLEYYTLEILENNVLL